MVTSIIMAGATLIAYILGESWVDGKSAEAEAGWLEGIEGYAGDGEGLGDEFEDELEDELENEIEDNFGGFGDDKEW